MRSHIQVKLKIMSESLCCVDTLSWLNFMPKILIFQIEKPTADGQEMTDQPTEWPTDRLSLAVQAPTGCAASHEPNFQQAVILLMGLPSRLCWSTKEKYS